MIRSVIIFLLEILVIAHYAWSKPNQELLSMENASIIIIEDEAIIAADLASKVERMGFHVLAVASGAEEAVEIATKRCPQLALVDTHLDGQRNGYMAAKSIQKLCNNLPIIFLSGDLEIDAKDTADFSGPYSFIPKPFERQHLSSEIEKLLKLYQPCPKEH